MSFAFGAGWSGTGLFERGDVPGGLWRLMLATRRPPLADRGSPPPARYLHLLPPLPIVTALSE
jgi:hypothetical protein